jgi:hypothetical protein
MTPEPEPSAAGQPVLTVAAMARRLGVAPSTLRTWDRRYGLGPSAHTAGSHRRYGPDDLRRLAVMRGLTLEGVPPAEAAQIALSPAAGAAGAAHPAAVAEVAPPGPLPGPAAPHDPAGDVLHDLFGDAVPGDALPGARLPNLPGDALPGERNGVPGSGTVFAPVPAVSASGAAVPVRPSPATVPTGVTEPGRGPALWSTGQVLPGVPRPAPPAQGQLAGDVLLGPVAPPSGTAARAGGGRVLSLPDASPRARGLARAAMALDTPELTRLLRDALGAYGVAGAWDSMIVPVLQGLGERWRVTGEGVDVEHAFSEAVLAALRGITAMLYRPRNVVPVLLACADGDHHTLPLHVMAAALAEEGVGCRMLGTGLPARHLVAAVRRTGPALVFVYARLPVPDASVLRELPRQRPAPRVLAGGPGWADVTLPATAGRVGSLAEALSAVLGAARL